MEDIPRDIRRQFNKVWWVMVLRGLGMIILALPAFIVPDLSAMFYVFLLALFIIFEGFLHIFTGIRGSDGEVPRWLYFLGGLLEIGLGAMVLGSIFILTAIATVSLYLLIAFGTLAGGVLELVIAIRRRLGLWQFISAFLFIAMGGVLIALGFSEAITTETVIQTFAVFLLGTGIFMTIFGIRTAIVGRQS